MLRERSEPGFERVLEIEDSATGLRGVLAIHSTQRGSAFGGIRRRGYPSLDAARVEVLDLAEAMTLKCALAGLPAGGAKAVIVDAPGLDTPAAYARLGEIIESLDGSYVCGPDVGTSDEDLDCVRAQTRHVNPAGNDAGASTATGVLAAARATIQALDGSVDFSGVRVAIEGLGAVGHALARMLLGMGARVSGADPDPGARARAEALGVQCFESGAALDLLPVDLLMPCALGGSLSGSRVEALQARAVCGSANNQLVTPGVDARLWKAGCLWAPDIAASAGAVIEGVHTYEALEKGREPEIGLRRRIAEDLAAIEATVATILARAEASDRPTGVVARELALERIG